MMDRQWAPILVAGIAGIALAVSVVSVSAQDRPDSSDGRFTFHESGGDLVRLDTRTGQVSTCIKNTVGWTCYAAADDRAALEEEIGRLQAENARLKDELLSKGGALPSARPAEKTPNAAGPAETPRSPNWAQAQTRLKSMFYAAWEKALARLHEWRAEWLRKE